MSELSETIHCDDPNCMGEPGHVCSKCGQYVRDGDEPLSDQGADDE